MDRLAAEWSRLNAATTPATHLAESRQFPTRRKAARAQWAHNASPGSSNNRKYGSKRKRRFLA